MKEEQDESVKEFHEEMKGCNLSQWCVGYNAFLLVEHWHAKREDEGNLVSRDMSWVKNVLYEKIADEIDKAYKNGQKNQ